MQKNRAPIRGHEHLDIPSRVKAVKLVDQLEHRSLNLIISTGAVIKSSATDGIDLIEEDYACLFS